MTSNIERTNRFELRLSKEERKEFDEAAARKGVSLADWVRLSCKRVAREEAEE